MAREPEPLPRATLLTERRVIRHLIPRFDCGSWGGAALTSNGKPDGDEVQGGCIVVQWLGLLIEIGVGVVR